MGDADAIFDVWPRYKPGPCFPHRLLQRLCIRLQKPPGQKTSPRYTPASGLDRRPPTEALPGVASAA